jgi:peptidoglycan/xylan/chitin deacetylase (PgdA/CDA1 family)
MTDGRRTDGPDGPDQRQRELLARRAAQREERRRRAHRLRLFAFASLALVAAAVAAIVVAGGSGGPAPSKRGRHSARYAGEMTTTPAGGAGGGDGLVRNATPQADWEPHTGPVPILEYHVLGAAPAGAPYPELYVTRPDFHRQMNWLEDHGYQAVTLEQVEGAWDEGGKLPPRPVVLSFDDGYRPQFTYALPELRRHGWAGVLNLKAEGSDLYESNVRAMLGAGWELASHTIDHSDLTALDAAGLERELSESRQILRREFGVPVKNFCYPAGRFDATVIAAVEAAGYAAAMTEIRGYASRERPYELDRFEILGSDGVAGLAADLAS